MDIKNSLLKGVDPYKAALDAKTQATGNRKAGAEARQTAPVQTGDRVSLSPAAMLHTVAHAAADTAPVIRQEKVDAIKEQVTSGSYTVDAKNVARKLLENDRLLAGTLEP